MFLCYEGFKVAEHCGIRFKPEPLSAGGMSTSLAWHWKTCCKACAAQVVNSYRPYCGTTSSSPLKSSDATPARSQITPCRRRGESGQGGRESLGGGGAEQVVSGQGRDGSSWWRGRGGPVQRHVPLLDNVGPALLRGCTVSWKAVSILVTPVVAFSGRVEGRSWAGRGVEWKYSWLNILEEGG